MALDSSYTQAGTVATPDGPTVSVVVCAYTQRRWSDLVAAVASLRRQTYPPLELLVVVDGNPGLLAQAKRGLEGVEVILSTAGRGLSAARNAGLRAARGEIVAFLDDDAVADRQWLAELVAAYVDPRVAGAGGTAAPRWVGGRAPRWLPPEFYWVVGCSYRGLPQRRAVIRNPIGACMSFRRQVLESAGGFHPGIGRVDSMPLGCEETELSIRALRSAPGSVILQIPAARVEHAVPVERQTWRYFQRRCWAEGRSKALVARRVGAGAALSAESAYTLIALPLGVARGIADTASGDPAGAARAAAILAGFWITLAGYLRGRLARARALA